MERYAVAFANLYREALEAYDAGRTTAVPRAWRRCFDTAATGNNLVLQDVLLGVNAHVNNDLAFALDRVSLSPDRERRRHDHNAVNQVLTGVTQRATQRLASLYAPGISTMDESGGRPRRAPQSYVAGYRARQCLGVRMCVGGCSGTGGTWSCRSARVVTRLSDGEAAARPLTEAHLDCHVPSPGTGIELADAAARTG